MITSSSLSEQGFHSRSSLIKKVAAQMVAERVVRGDQAEKILKGMKTV
jgi:hypothetical protein